MFKIFMRDDGTFYVLNEIPSLVDTLPADKVIDGVPLEIQILPLGQWEGHPNGPFEITSVEVGQIIQNFQNDAIDVVIDYEHNSELNGTDTAPASGWIKSLVDKGAEGLWAIVEWTERAAEFIRSKEYKYLSPAFMRNAIDGVTGEPTGAKLSSTALTNRPFIKSLPPLTASETKERKMNPELLKLLGLAPEATEKDVNARVKELSDGKTASDDILKAIRLEFALSEEGSIVEELKTKDVLASPEVLEALKMSDVENPSIEDIKAQVVLMSAKDGKMTASETKMLSEIAALTKRVDASESSELIKASEKVLTPAQMKEWGSDLATRDPESFKKITASMPVIVDFGDLTPSDDQVIKMTDSDRAVCKQMGMTETEWKDSVKKSHQN